MVIDVHNHITPQDHPYYLPPEMFLEVMDEQGIDKLIILGKDYGRLGDEQSGNLSDEDVARFVALHPDRFIGFTAVHPDRPVSANLDRLERAVQDLGLRGIKLNPASGFYPNDEQLYPVYERAVQLQIPVVIHSGLKPPSEGARVKYCRPLAVDDVAVDFPELTIIIAHCAYPWVEEAILVALYAPNVFLDISTLNQIEESLGYDVMLPTLRRLTAALGSGRVLFGSDGIFNIEPIKAMVAAADFLTDTDRHNIMGANARKILGI